MEINGYKLEPGAVLDGASLHEADLSFTKLTHAKMSKAFLWRSNLESADLSFVNLEHAWLNNTILKDANLSYANLSYAKLEHANLRRANQSSIREGV